MRERVIKHLSGAGGTGTADNEAQRARGSFNETHFGVEDREQVEG
jgi:hypothetical protein